MLIVADGPVDATDEPAFELPPRHARCRCCQSRTDLQAVRRRAAGRRARASATARRTGGRRSTRCSSRRRPIPSQFFLPANSWRFLLQANVPIFDSGQRAGAKTQRQAALDVARATLTGALTEATSQVRAAREAVASGERSLASARAAADQAQQVVNITNISFRAGAATNIEVIDAERTARDADTAVARRRRHAAPRAARTADRARALSVVTAATGTSLVVARARRARDRVHATRAPTGRDGRRRPERTGPASTATHCKNLFLRNQKGNRHYLVVLEHSKRADLKAVADQIGDGKLSFASPERLMTHLGLTPGSVSPFGLINDRDHAVRVVLDRDLKSADALAFHPNINTATFVIAAADFANSSRPAAIRSSTSPSSLSASSCQIDLPCHALRTGDLPCHSPS